MHGFGNWGGERPLVEGLNPNKLEKIAATAEKLKGLLDVAPEEKRAEILESMERVKWILMRAVSQIESAISDINSLRQEMLLSGILEGFITEKTEQLETQYHTINALLEEIKTIETQTPPSAA